MTHLEQETWSLRDVQYEGRWNNEKGEMMVSTSFRAELTAGERFHSARVAVTYHAVEVIKEAANHESSDPAHAKSKALEVVRRFVEWNLSHGGGAYWDPVTENLTLNVTDAQMMLQEMKA